MSVEVKNLQSGETFEVGPEGAIFGREGGPANIKVADQSVSKRHARIFSDGTDWFLEDMGSVNGTVVDGSKIGGITPLRAGLVFQMSKFRFEVITIDGRGRPQAANPEMETRTAMRGNAMNGGSLPSELRKDPIPKKKSSRDPPREPPPSFEQTNQGNGRNNLPLASDGDFPSQSLNSASQQSLPDVDAPRPVLGIDQYDDDVSPGAAVGMGIGYVLKTAPLLVFNPLGTVRRQIESPPVPGLEKLPLAAFVAPTYAVIILLQTWGAAIAAAIAGNFSVVSFVVGPVAAVIGGAIGGVVVGFLGHPILRWLVDKLGGSSDARSRTTHLAMSLVAALVMVVPTLLVMLFSAVAARLASVSSAFYLLNILPALISIVALAVPVLVQWAWFRSYNVVRWFQTLLLVFAVLGVVGGLVSAVTTVMAAVGSMRGTATPAVVAPDDFASDAVNADAGVATPETPETPSTTTTTKTPPETPPATTKTPPETPATTKTPPATASGDYGEYARKRQAIEDALTRDPTLVTGASRIGKLYEKLSIETYNAEIDAEEQVLGRKRNRDPARRAYLEKVKAAYVYRQTKDTVNDLYKLLPQ